MTARSRGSAWGRFEPARLAYAPRLEAMATYWDVTATSWLGADSDLARSAVHREPARREEEPIYL